MPCSRSRRCRRGCPWPASASTTRATPPCWLPGSSPPRLGLLEPGDRPVAEGVDEPPVVVARQLAVGGAERREVGGETVVLVADDLHQRVLDLEVDERLVTGGVRDAVDLGGRPAEVA